MKWHSPVDSTTLLKKSSSVGNWDDFNIPKKRVKESSSELVRNETPCDLTKKDETELGVDLGTSQPVLVNNTEDVVICDDSTVTNKETNPSEADNSEKDSVSNSDTEPQDLSKPR